jgi:hypothetical protein
MDVAGGRGCGLTRLTRWATFSSLKALCQKGLNGEKIMKHLFTGVLGLCFTAFAGVVLADVNVLVIGSTKPFDQVKGITALDKQKLVAQTRKALATDLRVFGKINVEFEDVYRARTINTAVGQKGDLKPYEYRCHSLAQWYFWPDGRDERLANLKGAGKTKWDWVVIVEDPYIAANMPGMFAEGLKLVAGAVRKGPAKPLLLIPDASNPLAEIICRAGKGAGIPVVPAATAAAMKAKCALPYAASHPFAMKYVAKRTITFNHTGSSSENGIQRALSGVTKRCGVNAAKINPQPGKPKLDFNYGRGNSGFEKPKQYQVNPELFERSYGFPMQDHSRSAAETMLFGIDSRYDAGNSYDDGTDLGIAWDMIRQDEVKHDIRCLPIRLLWAKFHEAVPEARPSADSWHMNKHLDEATATYLYTLQSGRCPLSDEPPPPKDDQEALRNRIGQSIGYETAWCMSHLTARAPGFAVRPVGSTESISSNATVEIAVKFFYEPTSDVTVSVASDKPSAASVKPAVLTFTPSNYATPQKVTITGGAVAAGTDIQVGFATSSKDEVFHQLRDTWSYKVVPPPQAKK